MVKILCVKSTPHIICYRRYTYKQKEICVCVIKYNICEDQEKQFFECENKDQEKIYPLRLVLLDILSYCEFKVSERYISSKSSWWIKISFDSIISIMIRVDSSLL